MKTVSVSYSQWKSLLSSKGLLPQYVENPDSYDLFAVEANVSWETRILRDDSSDVVDFETSVKSIANSALEYRSSDGLPKYAAAKFVDALDFYVDGEKGSIIAKSNKITYVRTNYSALFVLSGVDVNWQNANQGDYINFDVGIYLDDKDESTFQVLKRFGNQYHIVGNGERYFDVATVKPIYPKFTTNGTEYNIYVRTTYVNVGGQDVNLNVNLIGWH